MAKEYPTLPRRLLDGMERYASSRAQIHKVGQEWVPISSQELLRRIAGLSRSLAKLGVAEGDRVALFAPNCPEWHVFDFAALGLGATVVPIYFRESAERMAYILSHSEAKVILVAGEDQAKRWRQEAEHSPGIKRAVIASGVAGAEDAAHAGSCEMLSYEAVIA